MASAGLAPAVEIAIASGPLRMIAGRMKLQSGGTSTTFTSIARRSASSNTRMFTSVSPVAAITMKVRSRSPGVYSRRSQRIEPSSASSCSGSIACGRDERHLAVAGEQPLDLLEADVAASDHHAAAPGEPQAGDVERRVEHVLHAALIADPLAELADARLAGIGLGGHA